jgi:hypothetical protein
MKMFMICSSSQQLLHEGKKLFSSKLLQLSKTTACSCYVLHIDKIFLLVTIHNGLCILLYNIYWKIWRIFTFIWILYSWSICLIIVTGRWQFVRCAILRHIGQIWQVRVTKKANENVSRLVECFIIFLQRKDKMARFYPILFLI